MASPQTAVLEMIAGGAPLESILKKIVALVEGTYPDAVGAIMLVEDDHTLCLGAGPRLPLGFISGLDGLPVAADAASCGTAVFRREPVFSADLAQDDLWSRYRNLALTHGFHACWSVPIEISSERVAGTVALYHRAPRRPTADERGFATDARLLAAIAIEKHLSDEAVEAHASDLHRSLGIIQTALERIRLIVGDNWPVERERSVIANEASRVAQLIEELRGRLQPEVSDERAETSTKTDLEV